MNLTNTYRAICSEPRRVSQNCVWDHHLNNRLGPLVDPVWAAKAYARLIAITILSQGKARNDRVS